MSHWKSLSWYTCNVRPRAKIPKPTTSPRLTSSALSSSIVFLLMVKGVWGKGGSVLPLKSVAWGGRERNLCLAASFPRDVSELHSQRWRAPPQNAPPSWAHRASFSWVCQSAKKVNHIQPHTELTPLQKCTSSPRLFLNLNRYCCNPNFKSFLPQAPQNSGYPTRILAPLLLFGDAPCDLL